jgi:hypothetical protein
VKRRTPTLFIDVLGLRSPSLDTALRASLRLSRVRARGATEFVAPVRRREQTLSLFATAPPHPGDFVAALTPTYNLFPGSDKITM